MGNVITFSMGQCEIMGHLCMPCMHQLFHSHQQKQSHMDYFYFVSGHFIHKNAVTVVCAVIIVTVTCSSLAFVSGETSSFDCRN